MILVKSFRRGVSYDRFQLTYANLNEGDKVRKCYSRLKSTIQAHLYVGFLTKIFRKHVSFKRF